MFMIFNNLIFLIVIIRAFTNNSVDEGPVNLGIKCIYIHCMVVYLCTVSILGISYMYSSSTPSLLVIAGSTRQ